MTTINQSLGFHHYPPDLIVSIKVSAPIHRLRAETTMVFPDGIKVSDNYERAQGLPYASMHLGGWYR